MQKFFRFVWEIKKDVVANEIMPLATQLTYRFIFALFPFLIFLISLVGYFDLEPEYLMAQVSTVLPADIAQVVNDVLGEVTGTRNLGLLSGSLLLSLFTVANGFRAIMRGINRVYDQKDHRHIIKQWLICMLLVLLLAASIILSLLTIVFGDAIYALIPLESRFLTATFGLAGFAITASILTFAVILIYQFASAKMHSWLSLLPGAALTVAVWAASTTLFNFFINNFTNMSVIYGSIASVFITMLWLNIISITILIGAQLNAKL
ncbi:MAG: YihY/virulence factor BrkB family protein [Defluviitaleaceae bacterium]|nr:YihY/virulence factor BrkB family protein [Defluviitaleaceae bacterium]